MRTLIARDGNRFIAAGRGELDNPILRVLRDKGYELSMSFHLDVAYQRFENWHAVGHGWKHSGATTAELLAKVILAEAMMAGRRGEEGVKRLSEPDLAALIRAEALDITDPETRHQS